MKQLVIGVVVYLMLVSTSRAQVNSTWNGTSGNWSDFTRWSSNPQFPNNGNGGNDYNAFVNGGTVNVNLPITVQQLAFGGGTIVRSNDLTVNADFTWNFGSLTGAGLLKIDGGGTLSTNAQVSGGEIRFGDGVNPSTFAHTNLGRLVLNNSAQASVQNGTTYEINVTSPGSNIGSATSGTPGTFTVEAGGILRKTGPATHLIANNVVLNNNGTIEVDQGILSFDPSTATWANAGLISIASGSMVQKGTGTMNLEGGSAITGDGTFSQTSGTLNANGDNSISRLQLQGGTFNRSDNTTTTITDDFTWNFGSLTGAGLLKIDGGGTLSTNAQVSGGEIRFGDGVNPSTFAHTNLGRLVLNNSAQASVQNGTTYEINVTSPGSNIGSATSGTPGTFTVEAGGILRKTGPATHLIANNVVLNNNGTIEVDQGILSFDPSTATWANAGLISIASGSMVQKGTGTMNLEGGSAITGDGTFSQTSGTLNANGDNSISRLQLQGGTFNRSDNTTTTITDDFTWNFGSLTGAGLLKIDGGGTLSTNAQVSGGEIRFGDGVNPSTFAHTNLGRLVLNNSAQASVQNGTTYEINVTSPGSNIGSATSGTPGTFTVEAGGILRKTGPATHLIANNVVLNNNGTIEVDQGILSFDPSTATWANAGLISIASGSMVQKGTGTMNLEGGSAITGDGTFSQTSGTLNANGDNSISRLQLQGGTFNRSDNTTTTITDDFTWNFGSLTGAGLLKIDGGGTLSTNAQVSGGEIRFGDGVNPSTFAHTNLGRLVLNNSAQASVQNGTTYEINVTSPGSNIGSATSGTPGTFTVEAGGILRKTGPATHLIANNVVLNNNGTIEVDQGNLSFEIGGVLENSGEIVVNAGFLDFQFGGTFAANAGSVSLAPGATLRGNITNGSTGLLQGAGTVIGAVTLQTGGEIEAGVSETATTMTLTNGLTMADGSHYNVRLFGTGPTAISMVAVTGVRTFRPGPNFGSTSAQSLPSMSLHYEPVSAKEPRAATAFSPPAQSQAADSAQRILRSATTVHS